MLILKRLSFFLFLIFFLRFVLEIFQLRNLGQREGANS